jgi:hypothetical protein
VFKMQTQHRTIAALFHPDLIRGFSDDVVGQHCDAEPIGELFRRR